MSYYFRIGNYQRAGTIMYEMYPDAWTVFDDRHQATGHQPRRRARKEHSVVPAILAQAQKASPTRA